MIAVIFEVCPPRARGSTISTSPPRFAPHLETIDGFISVERFQSLTEPSKILSLSFWRDEAAVRAWRNRAHRTARPRPGRAGVFADYRLRMASVIRDYGMTERDEAPNDSRAAHQA